MPTTACRDMAVAELGGSEGNDDVQWSVDELPGGEDVGEPRLVFGLCGHDIERSILCEEDFEEVVA